MGLDLVRGVQTRHRLTESEVLALNGPPSPSTLENARARRDEANAQQPPVLKDAKGGEWKEGSNGQE